MELRCEESVRYLEDDRVIERNQRKTRLVVCVTFVTMVGEIIAGVMTGSMALTAEGWHMASHTGAMLIALFAYRLAKSQKMSRSFSFGTGKLIPLGGYTSAVVLSIVAILIAVESVTRLANPVNIDFSVAIGVACIGLCVNILSAIILRDDHEHDHDREEGEHHAHDHSDHPVHDHNIRSAFLHVLADAVTSVLAIGALTMGKFFGFHWLDPVIGIVGSIVILSWAFQLCRDTGWELLDGHSKTVDWLKLKSHIENETTKILDFHVWRIAPKAVACELIVGSQTPKGTEFYRSILKNNFRVQHIIIEERKI